jgi:hypothetical protein
MAAFDKRFQKATQISHMSTLVTEWATLNRGDQPIACMWENPRQAHKLNGSDTNGQKAKQAKAISSTNYFLFVFTVRISVE